MPPKCLNGNNPLNAFDFDAVCSKVNQPEAGHIRDAIVFNQSRAN